MKHLLLLLLLATPACAQAVDNMPRIPSEAEKKAALMLAYEANGNSMVLVGSVSLVPPKAVPPKADRLAIPPVVKDKQ